ncbi:MAG TPA: CopG family transcriptional regulator [Vicinamibacteria bacterium]|nr:CopG family transcriptional regulator [Vicinamibacteria bacterium]
MSTTVHIPPELLERVDRRAQELGVSRNLYIRRAIERAVETEASWSPAFLKMLGDAASDVEGAKAVDEMMTAIASRRTRKKPPKL